MEGEMRYEQKSVAKECINIILLLINIKIPSIVYDYYFKYSEGPYLQIAVIVEYSLTCIAWMILILYIIKVLKLNCNPRFHTRYLG